MTKSTPPSQTVIDHFFAIPKGAEESFVYSPETIAINYSESEESELGKGFDDTDETSGEVPGHYDGDTELEVPTEFSVIDQKLRRAPGGQQVVDVTIESEDIGGAVNYEFRVTKI